MTENTLKHTNINSCTETNNHAEIHTYLYAVKFSVKLK